MSAEAPQPRRHQLNTVREVCQEYIDRVMVGKTRDSSSRCRLKRVQDFMAAKGEIAVEDLINDDLEGWIEAHPTWKNPWTKKGVCQSIKAVFAFAWKKGLIMAHPFVGVSYPQGDRRKPMTEDQFRMLLRDADPVFRRPLLMLYWSGIRPKELCDLQWSMIDVKRGVAILEKHKTAHSRRDRGARIIVLCEKAIRLLTWLLDDQRGEQQYVFLNRDGKPWKRYVLGQRLWHARQRLGLPDSVKLYSVRHSFGTRLALAGTDLQTLATLMGHTSFSQSQHYIHMAGRVQHLHDALEKGLADKEAKL